MANLKSIIQLRKFQLDEKRLALIELQKLASDLAAQRTRLGDAIEMEKRAALEVTDPDAAFAFGKYVQGALDRRARLDESLRKVEDQIADATQQVQRAFAELKKFEQAQMQRQAHEARKRARAETMLLDDMGIEGFRRKAAGGGF